MICFFDISTLTPFDATEISIITVSQEGNIEVVFRSNFFEEKEVESAGHLQKPVERHFGLGGRSKWWSARRWGLQNKS